MSRSKMLTRKLQSPSELQIADARRQTRRRQSLTANTDFLQFKHAICVLLIFEASSSSWLAACFAPAGCCGAFVSMPHLEAMGGVGV